MDLMPQQLIGNVEFQQVRRGYDPAEVDAFLDRVEAAMGKLQQQLTEATARAQAAEARLAAMPEPGQAAPPAPAAGAEADTAGVEQVQRTLVLAQRTADAAIAEAQQEAEGIRSSAHAEAERVRGSAQAEVDRLAALARQAREAELRDLEGVRTALAADIALLQQHIDQHRSTIGATVAELQRWLEDPTSLRVADAPEQSGVTVPPAIVVDPMPIEHAVPAPEDPSAVNDTVGLVPDPDDPRNAAVAQESLADQGYIAPDPVPAPEPVAAEPTPEPEVEAPAEPVMHVDGPPPAAPAAPADELIDLSPPAEPEAPAVDPGPPTEAIDLSPAGVAPDTDDAFLAELRKAMTDEEPLGPRDDDQNPNRYIDDREHESRPRPRFGRRR